MDVQADKRAEWEEERPLVARAKAGDARAEQQLFERNYTKVLAAVYHRARQFDDAQEATQTAAVKVLIKLRDFRNESLFATWWTQVAINAYIDLVRQRARFVALPITGDPDGSAVPPAAAIEALLDGNSRIDPSQIVLSLELVAVLQRAIRQLTPKERSVFVLMHLHLLSLLPDGPSPAAFPGITEVNERTVAAYLRMPVGTVRGLNYQAVVKIRKALWQYLQAKPGEEGRAA